MGKMIGTAGKIARSLPPFRGKGRIAEALFGNTVRTLKDEDAIYEIQMRESHKILVDVRSRMEKNAFWTGDYEPQAVGLLKSFVKSGSVVLDVGANVGFISVALGSHLRSLGGGEIYAFEPVPTNFERFSQSIKANQLEGVIKAHNLALGDMEGQIEIRVEAADGATTGNAVLDQATPQHDENYKKTTRVFQAQIIPLDVFAERHSLPPATLIKVDVEGAEVLFLRGGMQYIERVKPVIYGEFNTFWLKQFGHTIGDVFALLKPLGYRVYSHAESGSREEITTPRDDLQDLLLIPE